MTAARSTNVGPEPAAVDPVAQVMVDVPLPHLDHPFDYVVPEPMDASVQLGSRVRVRFAGRLVDGYVLQRRAKAEHEGRLSFIERAVGEEPVLTAETTALFRAVADRWAGSFVDVVRLGVPARHAAAQAKVSVPATRPEDRAATGFDRYRAGASFVVALRAHKPARALWSALPGEDWPTRFAELAQVTLAAGRGVIAVVPDARDLARLDAAMTAVLGPGRYVALAAELGPAERYRRWLAVQRGAVHAAIGTRAAAYAPVAELGLLAIWDDGDDAYDEPRAPYAHTRDVLALRSSLTGAPLVIGGHARTAEAQQFLETGWAHEIVADRAVLHTVVPRCVAVGDDYELGRDPAATAARLPSLAMRAVRESLQAAHPVLIQVPRRGYVPSLACIQDRTPARCVNCSGPLAATASGSVASCRWCGRPAGDWRCPECGGGRMRAVVIGSARTAEELGRAFPGISVRTSAGQKVLDRVAGGPALVVATPGAEPVAEAGYGAVLLLDGWALLSRADLRAGEQTLRYWLNAAALARPGAKVIVGADASIATVQALVRWDPAGAASRELAERAELRFSPAVRMASLTGEASAVNDFLTLANLPTGAGIIGPVPAAADQQRMIIRVERADGVKLAQALRAVSALRSARRAAGPVKLTLDPRELF